ncbi:MAG: holo-ACP synthase [Spirochaetales bacterium]|nr:holo-ACP synthase [Spirochaetales bacterium]MCF7937120.1 holo-ACP synthase [Spirochaetales bacterium]
MIIGIGIDIVHSSRMEHWRTIEGIFHRYFHERELSDARSRGSSFILSLSARFAAKEAFGKAVGTGLRGMQLRDIQVFNRHNGQPSMWLYGTALEAFRRIGGTSLHISLTHERDNAVAVVIIEGDGSDV